MTIAKGSSGVSFSRRVIGPVVLVGVLLFAALVVLGGILPPRDASQPLTIILRYDDYSSISNTYLETQILKQLSKRHVPCTFAVIPAVTAHGFRNSTPSDSLILDGAKVAMLKPYVDSGLIEISLHGLTHKTVPGKSLQTLSEFVDEPYELQYNRILAGKQILESQFGHQVVSFVPPWGNYDENTIRAAEATGFGVLSADPRGPVLLDSKMLYVPGTCRMHELKEAIAEARQLPSSGTTLIMAVLHPYDFIETDAERGVMSFQQFEQLLDEISSDPGIRFATTASATSLISDLGASRFAEASSLRHSKVYKILPAPLRMGMPTKTYVDARLAVTLLERERIWCFTLYGLGLVGIAFSVNRGWKYIPKSVSKYRRKVLLFGVIILFVVSVYSLIDLKIYAPGLMTLTAMLGALIGTSVE